MMFRFNEEACAKLTPRSEAGDDSGVDGTIRSRLLHLDVS